MVVAKKLILVEWKSDSAPSFKTQLNMMLFVIGKMEKLLDMEQISKHLGTISWAWTHNNITWHLL